MKTAEAINKTLTDAGFTLKDGKYSKTETIDDVQVITTYDTATATLSREIAEWESSWLNLDTATKLNRTLDGLKYYKVTLKP